MVPGVGDHSFYLDVEDFVSSTLLVISIDCQVNSNSSISSSSQFFTVEMTIVLRNSLDLHKKTENVLKDYYYPVIDSVVKVIRLVPFGE